MPLIQGSSTPSANVVATTASTQSPPAASTAAPTSAAFRDCAATMPPLDVTTGLRICWALENWSCMGGGFHWLETGANLGNGCCLVKPSGWTSGMRSGQSFRQTNHYRSPGTPGYNSGREFSEPSLTQDAFIH